MFTLPQQKGHGVSNTLSSAFFSISSRTLVRSSGDSSAMIDSILKEPLEDAILGVTNVSLLYIYIFQFISLYTTNL
jgi:hypothetical protein